MTNTTRRADEWRRRAAELRAYSAEVDRKIAERENEVARLRKERADRVNAFYRESGYTVTMLGRLLAHSPAWISLQNKIARGGRR